LSHPSLKTPNGEHGRTRHEWTHYFWSEDHRWKISAIENKTFKKGTIPPLWGWKKATERIVEVLKKSFDAFPRIHYSRQSTGSEDITTSPFKVFILILLPIKFYFSPESKIRKRSGCVFDLSGRKFFRNNFSEQNTLDVSGLPRLICFNSGMKMKLWR
jgi:hypothetical protein